MSIRLKTCETGISGSEVMATEERPEQESSTEASSPRLTRIMLAGRYIF
ncbi:MAG TPA: hypothetical protein VJN71_08030 [Nitrososphaerales archaeon]|nr:hypothetical protein [Nitrososphaerales archaeon]